MMASARNQAEAKPVVRLRVLNLHNDGHQDSMMPLDESGACPMLESSGRCELHRRYGEAALSTACSVFPRTALKVGEQVEVSGSLACPELARLTLLSEDGVDQAESPTAVLPRDYIGKAISDGDEAAQPYAANFGVVRAALRALFASRGFPLSSRLLFAGHLAAQVDEFFHARTTSFAGKKQLFAQRRLAAEIALAQDTALRNQLHGDLLRLRGNDEAVLGTILSLLRQRLRLPHPPRYAAALGVLTSAEALCAGSLRDRHAFLAARWPGTLDRLLARYAQHYLLRSPYTDAPDLLTYLGRLALSLGAIKTMVLASPVVDRLVIEPGAEDDDGKALAELVAETVQIFTKAISHQASFLSVFHEAFESGQGTAFGRLVLLASYLR
jgi:lysine-N-methylase